MTRHKCDVCPREITLKGTQTPPGWLDLGVLGVPNVTVCTECAEDLAENIAQWVLAQRKETGQDVPAGLQEDTEADAVGN